MSIARQFGTTRAISLFLCLGMLIANANAGGASKLHSTEGQAGQSIRDSLRGSAGSLRAMIPTDIIINNVSSETSPSLTERLQNIQVERIKTNLDQGLTRRFKTIAYQHLEIENHFQMGDVFVYHDFRAKPVAYAVPFYYRSNAVTLYFTITSPQLIEVIRAKPFHLLAWDRLCAWITSEYPHAIEVSLERVYYHPKLYPFMQVKITNEDGGSRVILVDPEHRRKLPIEHLQLLRRSYYDINSRITDFNDHDYTAISTLSNSKVLDVQEVNIRGDWVGCGPAAAANVLGYWNDKGYEFLASGNSQTASKQDIDLLLNSLKDGMNTTFDPASREWWTAPYDAAPGVRYTIAHYGQSGSADWVVAALVTWLAHENFIWSFMKNEIESDRPFCVGGGRSVFGQHAVTAIGYKEGAWWQPWNRMLIIHDGSTLTPNIAREQRLQWVWDFPYHLYLIHLW